MRVILAHEGFCTCFYSVFVVIAATVIHHPWNVQLSSYHGLWDTAWRQTDRQRSLSNRVPFLPNRYGTLKKHHYVYLLFTSFFLIKSIKHGVALKLQESGDKTKMKNVNKNVISVSLALQVNYPVITLLCRKWYFFQATKWWILYFCRIFNEWVWFKFLELLDIWLNERMLSFFGRLQKYSELRLSHAVQQYLTE